MGARSVQGTWSSPRGEVTTGPCISVPQRQFPALTEKGYEPMSNRNAAVALAALACLAGVGVVAANLRNLAPDAITRATEGYNEHEGEIALLTDGRHPDNDGAAGVFVWPNKGNLTFALPRPEQVSSLRIYVGDDAGAYQATAYGGASYGDEGQTVTEGATVSARVTNFDFATNAWVDLAFPAGTTTDYIELSTSQGAQFYEIEIWADGQVVTGVRPQTWGEVKARVAAGKGQE